MNKEIMHTNKLTKELSQVKDDIEYLRLRRRELMWRLHYNARLPYSEIAKIYTCKRQFVQQEVKAHQETQPQMEQS